MIKYKKCFVLLILFVIFKILIRQAKASSEHWSIPPSRSLTADRSSRSSNNLVLETNNDLSELKPVEIKPVRTSYPSVLYTPNYRVNDSIEIEHNVKPNWIYSTPKPVTPYSYKPNYITSNQEIAEYLKNTIHAQSFYLNSKEENNGNTNTISQIPIMKGLRSVQNSFMGMIQKVKDFCSYVWRFFIDETAQTTVEGRKKKFKIKKKYKKFLLPLLLAYKLKFFTLVPILIGALLLLKASAGLAGFFFALFTAVLGLKHGGGGHRSVTIKS